MDVCKTYELSELDSTTRTITNKLEYSLIKLNSPVTSLQAWTETDGITFFSFQHNSVDFDKAWWETYTLKYRLMNIVFEYT